MRSSDRGEASRPAAPRWKKSTPPTTSTPRTATGMSTPNSTSMSVPSSRSIPPRTDASRARRPRAVAPRLLLLVQHRRDRRLAREDAAKLDEMIAQERGLLEVEVLRRRLHLRLDVLDEPEQLVLRHVADRRRRVREVLGDRSQARVDVADGLHDGLRIDA